VLRRSHTQGAAIYRRPNRMIEAKFSDGEILVRTTKNPNLAYGWRYVGEGPNGGGRRAGFNRTQRGAETAATQFRKYYTRFEFEVVAVTVVEQPAKARAAGRPPQKPAVP
jgi:hypothetical protein